MIKVLFVFACLVLALPAQASSMPKADFSGSHASLGSGPSISLDFSLSPLWAVGGSFALPLTSTLPGVLRYDLRSTYQIFGQHGFVLRGVGGIFGNVDPQQRVDTRLSPVGLEMGLAMAYRLNAWASIRLNVVAGLGFPYPGGSGIFPPSGGLELAVSPFPHFEATVGYNGNGDILAGRYLF